MKNDSGRPGQFSSPPCLAHELVDSHNGYAVSDSQTALDVARWRKAKRKELITDRLAVTSRERAKLAKQLAAMLDGVVFVEEGIVVSAYWPLQGELNLMPWMCGVVDRGGRIVLPVVTQKNCPLTFREWTPGTTMQAGFWNIPVPVEGAELIPDIMIAPVIGYDKHCFRLGYGGGYFDRTLAGMRELSEIIGVGLSSAEVPSIFPQSHDIPMTMIVTELGKVAERDCVSN